MSTTTTATTTFKSALDITSNAPIEVPRGPVESTLVFYAPPADNAAPFNYVESPPPGQPQRNYLENPHKVTINDIRDRESDFNLNIHGFATAQNVSSKADFDSEDSVKQIYYPEVEDLLLKHVPGAKRVFLFDHTIRRADPGAKRQPVNRAHIDQTAKAARQRVERHLPDEAPRLLQSRYRIINVWRPLNGPVVSFPLAYAASPSVSEDAVVPVEHRYPDKVGETAGVRFDEKFEWHYWSGMKNDERIFLQCFDSEGGKARTPHSAFVDPRTEQGWPGRESIEVRALVFG